MEDADEVFECYRRIERLLERVSVSTLQVFIDAVLSVMKFNANINIWKTVDEQTTVRASHSREPFAKQCLYHF